MVRLASPIAAVALLAACSEPSEQTELPASSQGCADPVELELPDGSCIRPGVAPDGCAQGFTHDGVYGCVPTLPAAPCAKGFLAVPGESECRPVMPCAAGRWGDIAVEPGTQYVDRAYVGTDSDGSSERPWTSIADALVAATAGAVVAVAEGTYTEDVYIWGKAVRLRGVCPDKVTIVGTGVRVAAVIVGESSDTEVSGVAVSGARMGIGIVGSESVRIERVWVHDTMSDGGIMLENSFAPTSASIADSLIEDSREIGIGVLGAEALVERTVVRRTAPSEIEQWFGRGLHAQRMCDAGVCSTGRLSVYGSVVEESLEFGLSAMGSEVLFEASVLRHTRPRAFDQAGGIGIHLQLDCNGLGTVCDFNAPARGTVRGSLVEDSHTVGVYAMGSEVTVESSVVRRVLPQQSDLRLGRGINVEIGCAGQGYDCSTNLRGNATVRGSLVEESHNTGLYVSGSDALIENVVVRKTWPGSDMKDGHGLSAELACPAEPCDLKNASNATVRASLIEDSHDIGVLMIGAATLVESSVVRRTSTRALDGIFGDGVAVVTTGLPAATFTNTRIEDSARAGLAGFGAQIALTQVHIQCASFALAHEVFMDIEAVLEDRGDNLCGCPTPESPCQALSAGLQPPDPPQ